MTFGRRLNNVENILQQDSAERAFNKLARTFAVQMEALSCAKVMTPSVAGGKQQHAAVRRCGRCGGRRGPLSLRSS